MQNLDYYDQTTVHPLGLAALLALGCLTLVLPRRWAVLPTIAMGCFIAPAQRIVLASLDFNFLRLMVMFGWLRVLMRGEHAGFRASTVDLVAVVWALSGTAALTLLHGSSAVLAFTAGEMFDSLGMYFLFRVLVRGFRDLDRIALGFLVISVPVALAFLIEKSTGRNVFAVFGGVPYETDIREGRLRCQGAFAHPILAGCFWAAVLPLMVARSWARPGGLAPALLACVTTAVIVVACASSTPVASVFVGLVGALAFPLRRWMRVVRWTIVAGLIGLHAVMKAPVWHLVSRVDLVGGSTGWHRAHLIDEAIRRVPEWWLIGTESTAHWGHGLNDITNQYVFEAVRGGLATVLLFLALLALGFQRAGRLWRAVRSDRTKVALSWALGVALLVHCMSFLAVSYFDQIRVVFFLELALLAGLSEAYRPRRRAASSRAARPAHGGSTDLPARAVRS